MYPTAMANRERVCSVSSRSKIVVRSDKSSNQPRVEKYKRELGRALATLDGVRIYHNKTEILIRWKAREVRYFPEDSFRVLYGKRKFENVSIEDLANLVRTGKMRGVDVA